MFADVGRTGLGNMLFPWARAEVFRERYGVPMLAPRWTQPKIGPLLRGEKDKRYYVGLFDNSGSRYVRGPARYLILWRAPRVPASDAERFMAERYRVRGTRVVVFSGWEGWLNGLEPHRRFVSRRLHEILKPAVKARLDAVPIDFTIGVHVRRGDMRRLKFGEALNGRNQGAIADEWFINAIRGAREALGLEATVRVFSDARADEIPGILALPGVTLAGRNPAIVDLLLLSRSRVLITTGTSSFSAWASYLGGMPTLWYPECLRDLNPERPGLGVETDLHGNLGADAARVVASAAT